MNECFIKLHAEEEEKNSLPITNIQIRFHHLGAESSTGGLVFIFLL